MKKNKFICALLMFTLIITFTTKVNAKNIGYSALECNGQRWSLDNYCKLGQGEGDTAKTINDSVMFKLDEHNHLYITEDIDVDKMINVGDFACEEDYVHSENYTTSKCFNNKEIILDYSAVVEYYNQTKEMPNIIVTYYSKSNNNNGYFYYYYPSALEPVSKSGKVVAYYAKNPTTADLYSCDDFDVKLNNLQDIKDKYGVDSSEFSQESDRLIAMCKNWETGNNKSQCYEKCWDMKVYVDEIAAGKYSKIVKTNSCGLGKDMVAWILRILKIIRYIVPIIVVVTSTLEYIGAISSASDDALKKVGGRFSKRLFIMILIFLIPSLLQFIFNVFNIEGLSNSGAGPYCLK